MQNYSKEQFRKLAIEYYGKARAWRVVSQLRRAYLLEARYFAYRAKSAI